MSNVDLLARAYALADTGNYSTVTQIRNALSKDGFSSWELSQLSGKELAGKLRARMSAAKASSRPVEG